MEIKKETLKKVHEWMLGDNTGMSSLYLCSIALDMEVPVRYPHDPADFDRCYKFLAIFTPEEQEQILKDAAMKSPKWRKLWACWDKLVALYKEECVGEQWKAPKLYELMKSLGV